MEKSGARNRMLIVCVVIAVLVKALLLFVAIPYLHEASPTTYQAERFPDWYDLIAKNFAEGYGYRFFPDTTETMIRTPGWVLVLAGIFSVFGHSLAATKVVNLVFSLATACLAYFLGKRITKSHRLGLIAAIIAFLHPAVLVADSRGGAESLFTLSLMLFIFLVYRAIDTDALRDYLFAGVALGIALLIKSTAALFPPFLFLYLIALRPSLERMQHVAIKVGAMTLIAGVVLSPWIIRNYMLSGEFVPTMSVGGKAAFEGLYVATNFSSGREHYTLVIEAGDEENVIAQQMGLKFKPGYYPQFYTISDEVKFYGHLGDIVKKRYLDQPSLLMSAIAFNARGFWVQGRTVKATTLNTILVVPFLVIVIWGIYTGLRQSLMIVPILLFSGAFYAAHVAILGQARYHVPLIPLLAILACIPLRSMIGDVPGYIKRG